MVLQKYINCIVDELLALALAINYVNNYSIIIIATTAATAATIIIKIIF